MTRGGRSSYSMCHHTAGHIPDIKLHEAFNVVSLSPLLQLEPACPIIKHHQSLDTASHSPLHFDTTTRPCRSVHYRGGSCGHDGGPCPASVEQPPTVLHPRRGRRQTVGDRRNQSDYRHLCLPLLHRSQPLSPSGQHNELFRPCSSHWMGSKNSAGGLQGPNYTTHRTSRISKSRPWGAPTPTPHSRPSYYGSRPLFLLDQQSCGGQQPQYSMPVTEPRLLLPPLGHSWL